VAWRSTSVSPLNSMAITELMARSETSSLLPSMEVKQLRADATSRNTSTSSVRAINTNGSKMPCVRALVCMQY